MPSLTRGGAARFMVCVVARSRVGYSKAVRPLWMWCAFLAWAACGGGGGAGAGAGTTLPDEPAAATGFADEDRFTPAYGKAELSRALIAERGAEAAADRALAELEAKAAAADPPDLTADERVRTLTADLAVRRRFIASLEACEAGGRWCPPRLDDPPWAFDPDPDRPQEPPVESPRRFDLASWQKLAAELHGRACACRTLACVDSVGVAIDVLEARPMTEVTGDGDASLAVTRARECLFRLRGRAVRARAPRVEAVAPAGE